jgi:hypothetical protein
MPFIAKLKQLDLLGIMAIISAVCCLILALQWGQETGQWRQSRVVGCFVGAFFLVLAFGWIQWRKGQSATIPLKILRQRSIFMGAWYLFFLEMAIYVVRCPPVVPQEKFSDSVLGFVLYPVLLPVCATHLCHLEWSKSNSSRTRSGHRNSRYWSAGI